jgi:hypothetical protein
MNTIGISVAERESNDSAKVNPSDIFVFGGLFTSRRGPVRATVPVCSPTEDIKVFGELGSSYLGGYIRRGLLKNCQEYGAKIYGNRIVASDAAVASLQTSSWQFTSSVLGYDSPGVDGNNTFVQIQASAADPTGHCDVLVFYQGPKDDAPVLVETWQYLTNTTVMSSINGNSYYINVTVAGTMLPTVTDITALTGGSDGTSSITLTDYENAYPLFNGLPISAVMNCDLHAVDAAMSLQDYVEGQAKMVGVIASPYGMSTATLASNYSALLKIKSFLAGYRSWGTVNDGDGGTIDVPMLGHALGAGWVRKCRDRGGFPWIAPAGETTALRDVYELEFPTYGSDELSALNATGFNPVQYIPGAGNIVRTSRTFSTLRKYYSIHVRRMTNWFISSFQNSFLWLEQEPANSKTRSRVFNELTFFAQDCWVNGAFRDRGGYDNNVQVKCDDENNTAAMEDAGQLKADFTFHPVEAIESGTINIFQTRDDLKVTANEPVPSQSAPAPSAMPC